LQCYSEKFCFFGKLLSTVERKEHKDRNL
jgi:hypothetical protein